MTDLKKKISLRHCELTTVPEIAEIEPNTEALFLDGNQLNTLPENIDQLAQLQILDLSYNNLTSLPNSFSSCEA